MPTFRNITIAIRGLFILPWTLVWCAIGILTIMLNPKGNLYSYLARHGWAKQSLALGGIKLKVKTETSIDWSKPYVICANHQSMLDIPILFSVIPGGIRFFAKRILFLIPIFGWSLFLARFISIDRKSTEKSHRSIKSAVKKLKKGPSLMVFPEGTRTLNGEISEFKSGAFIMALKAKTPVLPVAIRGTFKILPRGKLLQQPGNVEILIGSPFNTDEKNIKDKNELKKTVRDKIIYMFENNDF